MIHICFSSAQHGNCMCVKEKARQVVAMLFPLTENGTISRLCRHLSLLHSTQLWFCFSFHVYIMHIFGGNSVV